MKRPQSFVAKVEGGRAAPGRRRVRRVDHRPRGRLWRSARACPALCWR
ncbi:hypothetical protein [Alloyangia mangrovi]|nr:hypothetical protein [Alloyangia mangrovi]